MIHSLSKTLAVAALAIMMSAAGNIAAASDGNKSSASDGREYVRTPNYALAERFSAKRIGQMVFSTEVRPEWFKDGKRFLYSWKTSEGTQYYIADPVLGKVVPAFDRDKLAMRLTEIVRDPYDARHIPFSGLGIDKEDDNYLKFSISKPLVKAFQKRRSNKVATNKANLDLFQFVTAKIFVLQKRLIDSRNSNQNI